MPVIFKEFNENGINKNTIIKGEIILPVEEVDIIYSVAKYIERSEATLTEADNDDVFADALASVGYEEEAPYKKGDVILLKTNCKIRSSDNKSMGFITLKLIDEDRKKIVPLGETFIKLDGNSDIEVKALVTDTPNEYIKKGDYIIEVTPLLLQAQ